ncbi:Patatin-like protein 2 [Lasiodiplodia theobromae]|uniref:Patatin-like protein 2 n=1 Tax=Lasiodiplodia theobromae TaxID=45133 RepID=A0A5N5CXL4_9PEZI|nr:Patatin-like protein 2 [Lasiodiplodia theobromae]
MDNPLDQMTHLKAESLESLPPQTTRIPAGQYAVKGTKEMQVPRQGEPLGIETIRRIRGLEIFAETHDQGSCDDPAKGNWTWVELAILENELAQSPRKVNDIEFVWYDHSIRHDEESEEETGKYKWRHGNVFRKKHKILRLMEPGNCIAVRLCSRFTNWTIYGRGGYLVIDIDNDAIPRKPVNLPHVNDVTEKVKMMHDAFNSVNEATQAAFQPSPPPVTKRIHRADSVLGWERPLRVLALDGGGVRGYSSLLILKEVMARMGNPKPCDVFDMIGGTSTGGLIAIMLGRLQMNVDECIKHYEKDMIRIFGKKENEAWLSKKVRGVTEGISTVVEGRSHDAGPLEDTVRKLVSEKLRDEKAMLLDDSNKCKVFVMAFDKKKPNNSGPVYLRSYASKEIFLSQIKIWEAARATSAAPTYFDPMKVVDTSSKEKPVYELIDGGLGANNPLGWLWNEVIRVYGPTRPTDCFLSIGTGIPASQMLVDLGIAKGGLKNIEKFMGVISSIATNTQITHILFGTLINSLAPVAGNPPKYWRLNVGQHGQDKEPDEAYLQKDADLPAMDDSGKISTIRNMTKDYIIKATLDISASAEALSRKESTLE